jgi:hypothetical protein
VEQEKNSKQTKPGVKIVPLGHIVTEMDHVKSVKLDRILIYQDHQNVGLAIQENIVIMMGQQNVLLVLLGHIMRIQVQLRV